MNHESRQSNQPSEETDSGIRPTNRGERSVKPPRVQGVSGAMLEQADRARAEMLAKGPERAAHLARLEQMNGQIKAPTIEVQDSDLIDEAGWRNQDAVRAMAEFGKKPPKDGEAPPLQEAA